MLRILTHKANEFDIDQSLKGSFLAPAGTSKLVAAMITSTATIGKGTDVNHRGFQLKLQVNNKVDNPGNNGFTGGKDEPVFDNLSEKRWLKLNSTVMKSSRIDYTIIINDSTYMEKDANGKIPYTSIKLYLKFE